MRWLSGRKISPATSAPPKIASPPSSGVACLASPMSFSSSTAPMRRANRAASGVSTAATAKATSAARTAFVPWLRPQDRRARLTAQRQELLTSRETGLWSAACGEATPRRRCPATSPPPPQPSSRSPTTTRVAAADAPARVRRRRRDGRARRRRPARVPVVNPSDHPIGPLSSKFALALATMSDSTVAYRRRGCARRPRPTWGLHEGDELAPGRTVLRRIGGGRRYEALLVWDDHRLAVLVAKVLRPDHGDRPTALARPAPRGGLLARLGHPVVVRGFGAVARGPLPAPRPRAPRRPDARRAARAATARWRSSSCCRSACTSPPRCTTWPARASCTSTSSRATSSWAARRG